MSVDTSSRVPAREWLIETQRRLVEATHAEIDASLDTQPPELESYRAEYQARLQGHRGAVPITTVVSALAAAGVAYFGDYHTLRESQKAPLRLLRALRRSGRQVVLATEVIHVVHQQHLDAYLAGELDDDAFLRAIDYPRTWGFSWDSYRLHFQFAREHGIPVFALNSAPATGERSLRFRDALAALVIAEACARHPDALVAAIFGDLHIAPEHLPQEVDRALAHRQLAPRKRVIVYQNANPIYWSLAADGLEQSTEAVRLDAGAFCLINSTPLVKAQSYLHWEQNEDELEESRGLESGPRLASNVMTEQVLEQVHRIADFLGVAAEGLDDFSVHTARDLDFLDKLIATGDYTDDEIEEIRQQMERDESYFITRANIIYLGQLSIDHAAEEATHYLNTHLAGHVARPPDRRFDFYYRALKEAIGFFGSKIINHKRRCHGRADFELIARELRGRRLTGRADRMRRIARDVLRHLDHEERWRRGEERGYPRFRGIYERQLDIHIGITHSLGYMLGDRIHAAVMAGRIRRNEIRHLFRERFTRPERPRECYFDWIDYLQPHS